jgi:hypothetical protein
MTLVSVPGQLGRRLGDAQCCDSGADSGLSIDQGVCGRHSRRGLVEWIGVSVMQYGMLLVPRSGRTLVFQEIAHPRPSRKDQLCHILHDLGLGLVRQGLEPFRQPDLPYERSAGHGPGRADDNTTKRSGAY